MAVNATLQTVEGVDLHVETVGRHTHLVVEDHSRVASHFKHQARTTAGTSTVVEAKSGQAIVITDIILSQEKVSAGFITIQFDDDATNTVILLRGTTVDGDLPGLHIPFAGRVRGWKDARVEMVTVGVNVESDVTVVYYHLSGEQVLSFEDWDKLR